MPTGKDLKRLVRARMTKTGESYTAARAQLLKKKIARGGGNRDVAYAEIAGMSDASVKAATGCTWERWVRALDKAGAATKSHREIAKLVAFFGTPSWWTQMVTVGYERIRGLRARGQQRSGAFQATKSRTFDADVAHVFDAFASTSTRKRWLGEDVAVRSATAPKRIRLAWPDGTSVVVGFVAKGPAKSSAAIQHDNLATRAAALDAKRAWGERLDRLAEIVTARSS